jgi:glucose/arabinose dehydrogenase
MRRSLSRSTAIALAAIAAPSLAQSQPEATTRLHCQGIYYPVAITTPPAPADAGRIFILGRLGQISIASAGTGAVNPNPFLDFSALVTTVGDGGALGLAFDPNYSTSGLFYVYYNQAPSGDAILARYHVSADPNRADPASAQILFRYPRPIGHNSGWIGFSPIDGYLYLTSGDAGTGVTPDPNNNAQTLTNNLYGKLLRLDPSGDDFPDDPQRNYRIPPSNPFVGLPGDDEIFAYGLRNVWRASFDRSTGDLWMADVGQDQREEIDFHPAAAPGGQNYGWRCTEGTFCTGLTGCTCNGPTLTPPIYEYDHTVGRSITGGYVYRGSAIPTARGAYFFADFQFNRVWSLRYNGSTVSDLRERTADFVPRSGPAPANISAFGEDAAGELYLCDYGNARIFKVIPPPCPADFNTDGSVDIRDFLAFLAAFAAADPRADMTADGHINIADFLAYLAAFATGC